MDKICCVIDFDGFEVCGRFLVREFGYIGTGLSSSANSVRFDLSPFEKDLKPGDWKIVKHVTDNVTGLPFLPLKDEETIPLSQLESKVVAVHTLFKDSQKVVVAYKGGHYEKDVLGTLKIPCLNLEQFGCPKYDDLKKTSRFENCGYHGGSDKHCPLAEVTAFRNWMLDHLSRK